MLTNAWHVKDSMFDVNQIYKIDSPLLSKTEIENFETLLQKYSWEFDNISYDGFRTFWLKQLWGEEKSYEIEFLFRNKIESLFDIKLETVEMVLNGQAHGQCGSLHTDEKEFFDKNSEYITLIYYAHRQWSPEQGGFTVVIDRNNNIHSFYPKPNSAVLFNSRLHHVGLEPTIHCRTQRISFAQKLKILKD